MPNMARKKLNLPKWSGELARSIDIRWSLLNPKTLEERWPEVFEARLAKLPALAKALGLPPRPREVVLLEAWYAAIAVELAVLVCPGFQEKPPPSKLTHPRNIRWLLAFIDKWKRDGGHVKFDLEEGAEILKLEPVKSDSKDVRQFSSSSSRNWPYNATRQKWNSERERWPI
jgi:hypothetical protein